MATQVTNGLDLLGQNITGLGDPSQPTHAVNLQYLQNFVRGLAFKDPVRAASTGNINISSPGASIDGVSMSAGQAFLAKDQTTGSEKGIYVWNGASVAATRRNDADSGTELRPGTAVAVTEGSTNADKLFIITSDAAITIGTSDMTWAVLPGAQNPYTGTNGINVSGQSITGVVASGGGLAVGPSGFSLDTTVATRKASGALGNGSLTSITVTHNLNNTDVQVGLRLASTGEFVIPDWVPVDANNITFRFATAPANGAYRWSVQG